MKVYNTLKELKKDIVDNTLTIDDDIEINFDLNMPRLIIKADNIKANYITASVIKADNIKASGIDAYNIEVVFNVFSQKINAHNLYAGNIKAHTISYFASCCTEKNLICNQIKPKHPKGKHWSLDGKVIINGKELKQ